MTVQDNVHFEANNATNLSVGDAVRCSHGSELRVEDGVSFANNTAAEGAAVYVYNNSIMVVAGDAIFETNDADYAGGAVLCRADSVLRIDGSCYFFSNSAYVGGAVYVSEGM